VVVKSAESKATARVWCSFCGKPNTDVERLVAGPGVTICDQCVELAATIIKESRDKPVEIRLPVWGSMSDHQMLDHIPRMAVVAGQVESDLRSWVQELRGRGVTWSRIGTALGVTRQSAWERFSGEE
jgi:hypothetical protein